MLGFLNWTMSFNSFTAINTFEPVDEIICSDYFQIKGFQKQHVTVPLYTSMPLLRGTDLLATDFGFCRDGNSLAGNYSTIYVIVMKFALSYIVFQFDGPVSVAVIRKVIGRSPTKFVVKTF